MGEDGIVGRRAFVRTSNIDYLLSSQGKDDLIFQESFCTNKIFPFAVSRCVDSYPKAIHNERGTQVIPIDPSFLKIKLVCDQKRFTTQNKGRNKRTSGKLVKISSRPSTTNFLKVLSLVCIARAECVHEVGIVFKKYNVQSRWIAEKRIAHRR